MIQPVCEGGYVIANLVKHLQNPDQNVMTPFLRAVGNLLSFDNKLIIDFFLFDQLLDVYLGLAQQFSWNESVLSEITFGLFNIIASEDFNHLQQVLAHQFVWSQIVLKGLQSPQMLKYSREALECVGLVLQVSDEENVRLFVLAEKRLNELINGLITVMKSKNEKVFDKAFTVIDRVFQIGGQTATDEFEKAKGLDLLEEL